jgi:hypothetical protein
MGQQGWSTSVKSKRPPRAAVTLLCLSLFLFSGGCSREEAPETTVSKKIILPIEQSPQLSSKRAPTEGSKENAGISSPATPAEHHPVGQENAQPPLLVLDSTAETLPPENERPKVYRVREGDTLFHIAGLKEVYGDPLKWTSLFRLNMDTLDGDLTDGTFERRALPKGLTLKIRTSSEEKKRPGEKAGARYAINVVSSTRHRDIVPVALTLMKNGYFAYVARAEIKGEEWVRLRVGFFEDFPAANLESQRVSTLLNGRETWLVQVSEEELEEFSEHR